MYTHTHIHMCAYTHTEADSIIAFQSEMSGSFFMGVIMTQIV